MRKTIVMPMYNLLYYSKNFRKTRGSFWNYYPNKPNSSHSAKPDGQADNMYGRTRVFYTIKNSESFDYKNKMVGNLPDDNNAELNNIKFVVPLKNLSNFISNLDFLMINAEIEFILKWSKNCVLTEGVTREFKARGAGPSILNAVNAVHRPTNLKFSITDCKLYVPVVTLQEKYENKLFENFQTGMGIDFEWKR